MFDIPDALATGIAARVGGAGQAWLAALPETVAELCRQWNLVVVGPPRHGHLAMVLPARRHDVPSALKVSWQDVDTIPEHGEMLLERLDAGSTLFDLSLDQAVQVAGAIVRGLAIPGDSSLPTSTGSRQRLPIRCRSAGSALGGPSHGQCATRRSSWRRPGEYPVNRDGQLGPALWKCSLRTGLPDVGGDRSRAGCWAGGIRHRPIALDAGDRLRRT